MIAVSIVVMMAVPVLGLVGNGAGTSSDDIAVSITDTDSMGGDGFHGDEGAESDALFVTEEYVPGSDMGVGFAEGESESPLFNTRTGDTPRVATGTSGSVRRDKPSSSTGQFRTRSDRTDPPIRPGVERRPFAVPPAPVLVSQRLRVSDDNCVEDIVAEVPDQAQANVVPVKVVLASGR